MWHSRKLCSRCFGSNQTKKSQIKEYGDNKGEQSRDSLWNIYCCASVHTVSIEPARPPAYNRVFVVKKKRKSAFFFSFFLPGRIFLLVILAALRLFSPTLLWGKHSVVLNSFPDSKWKPCILQWMVLHRCVTNVFASQVSSQVIRVISEKYAVQVYYCVSVVRLSL